jgi:septum formation protein
MVNNPTNIILASGSKIRQQVLLNAGVLFEVETSNVDEGFIKAAASKKPVEDIAMALAIAKARAVSTLQSDALVIGADQILECGGLLFDKPTGRAGAKRHLKTMRGKTHRLVTSACVVRRSDVVWQFTDEAYLTMRPLSDVFIERYLDLVGESALLSVGAYQLENLGSQLFTSVKGDFFSVLGLPLLPLLEFLRKQRVLIT